MKHAALGLALALGACAAAQSPAGPKPTAGMSPAPSAEVAAPQEKGGSILFLLAAIYDWPESAEGKPAIEIDIEKNAEGAFVATVIQTGLLDDSIAATKDVLTLAHDGEWRVSRMEQYRKCYRTGMFEWTSRPCP